MRSKVRIDDDLTTELRVRAQAERLSMTRMLNRMLRSSLAASNHLLGEIERHEEVISWTECLRVGRRHSNRFECRHLA